MFRFGVRNPFLKGIKFSPVLEVRFCLGFGQLDTFQRCCRLFELPKRRGLLIDLGLNAIQYALSQTS